MKKNFLFLVLILVFFSCDKIQHKEKELVRNAKDKVSETTKKVYKKSIDKIFEYSTQTKPANFDSIYKSTGIKIENEKGLKIEYISDFYQYFLKYKGNKVEILNYLSHLKTEHAEISDTNYMETDDKGMTEKLDFIKSKFPDLYSELTFFTEFKNKSNLKYYTISKYPYSNIIIYDKINNNIYHFIENYKD